jgi:hypothetical protein
MKLIEVRSELSGPRRPSDVLSVTAEWQGATSVRLVSVRFLERLAHVIGWRMIGKK